MKKQDHFKQAVRKKAEITDQPTDVFMNTAVKNFALYVITTRAVPNIMDGMRIGARKILQAVIHGELKRNKKVKMPNLIGDVFKLEFHHGDSSLKNTIEQLGSTHLYKAAPLEILGQKGSLRVPDASTAARYLSVTTTAYLDMFKIDQDLLTLNFEDGSWTEPKFFLPIIPIALLWRTNSPGFGFSFRSFSFNFDDIINATLTAVINGTCSGLFNVQLKPDIEGINPDNIIYNQNKLSWYNVGEYEIQNDLLIVLALPYNISYNSYEEHLNELKDKGYIVDFANRTMKGNIKYVITFAKGRLQTMYKEKWKFYTNMRLFTKIPKLTLNSIDIDGKSIINFETPNDLVDGFVKRRLTFYADRKTRLIKIIEENILELTDKAKFIQLVVDEKLLLNKRSIADITKDCVKLGVSTNGLALSISKLTQDEIDKALDKIESLKLELIYIRNTTISNMYIQDLIALKEKHSVINNPLEIKKVQTKQIDLSTIEEI